MKSPLHRYTLWQKTPLYVKQEDKSKSDSNVMIIFKVKKQIN